MAKKRKTRASKKKETKDYSGFWRGVGAVTLIILGVVLAFGSFTDAPIPKAFWDGSWDAIGAASILAPFALIYLGALKFLTEDQRIPLPKMAGVTAFLMFFASWLHVGIKEGYGGKVGEVVGDMLSGALGDFLASLIFFLLTLFAFLFSLAIEPKSLLKLLDLFRREPREGEEDLAKLKGKMAPGFQLHEGVPVEHSPAKLGALKGSAQKMTPEQDHAALTTTSDPDWQFPSLDLLSQKQDKADPGNVQDNAETIKDTFANFNIEVEVEGASVGPRVTQYTIKPPTGVKLTRLTALEDNLKLDLAAHNIRMEAPIPGKRAVGVEVPNVKASTVTVRSLLSSSEWGEAKNQLTFAVGKDIVGNPVIGNLDTMPHLLIAGQTGSGKSVMINTLLTSLLYRNSPADLKLILVDPKQVEMSLYKDIPHLLAPVITEPEKCISALKWSRIKLNLGIGTPLIIYQSLFSALCPKP